MSDSIKFSETGLPFITSPVYRTSAGTPYLKRAGMAMVARPHVDLTGVKDFLDGFDPALGFGEYLDDPTDLPPAEKLVKFFGQACYLSLGHGRTMNEDCKRYIDNLKSSGHGSCLEHPVFSFFIWGIDRSVTHELVRHRAGFGFSQVSQRYVDGTKLRFVERPEFQSDRLFPWDAEVVHVLHRRFELGIDGARRGYEETVRLLIEAKVAGHPMLRGGTITELRKMVNQVAREGLPNSAEAPIGVTANVRAWRHACEMRANSAADVQIREMALGVCRCIRLVAPILFDDYDEIKLESSGTVAITTSTRKV